MDVRSFAKGWDEEKHPRDARGRFASTASLNALGATHSLHSAGRADIEAAIRHGGFAAYLSKHPVSQVLEHTKDPDKVSGSKIVRSANGVYVHKAGETPHISISDMRTTKATFARNQAKIAKRGKGQPSLGGEHTFSVSQMAKSPNELRQATMIHELSHHLHLDPTNPLPARDLAAIQKAYDARVGADKERKPGAWTPSIYSQANDKEWFAEAHTAYILHGAALKKADPGAYALIQRIRKRRGMLT
jgi:hypothetical protein